MDSNDAIEVIKDLDQRDRAGGAQRLIELTELLPSEGMVGLAGQAAEWLFEDVKATWLFGCFTGTILTAHAFCGLQLAGHLRLLPDNPELPERVSSLEELATLAGEHEVIGLEEQAQLLELHDRACLYTAVTLHEYRVGLYRHLVESDAFSDEHPLLADARNALRTAVTLVYRTP